MIHRYMLASMVVLVVGVWAPEASAGDMTAAQKQCADYYKETLDGTYTFRITETTFGVLKAGGWTVPAVKKYLGVAQWARRQGQLSCLGIPFAAGDPRYDHRTAGIYLFDARPDERALTRFLDEDEPEFSQVAALVKGFFVWAADTFSEDKAAVGFKVGEQRYNEFELYKF